jgi:hypothetical protein
MKILNTVLGVSSVLAIMGASPMVPSVASAQPVARTYVACNQFGDCWRVRQRYAYGETAPIIYYNADWYDAHRNDPNIRWRTDPTDDKGYYLRDGTWHADPGARALAGGLTGAGVGAAIGCLVTLPAGCAPGAAVGAAVGGGTGAVAGAASTPHH